MSAFLDTYSILLLHNIFEMDEYKQAELLIVGWRHNDLESGTHHVLVELKLLDASQR